MSVDSRVGEKNKVMNLMIEKLGADLERTYEGINVNEDDKNARYVFATEWARDFHELYFEGCDPEALWNILSREVKGYGDYFVPISPTLL